MNNANYSLYPSSIDPQQSGAKTTLNFLITNETDAPRHVRSLVFRIGPDLRSGEPTITLTSPTSTGFQLSSTGKENEFELKGSSPLALEAGKSLSVHVELEVASTPGSPILYVDVNDTEGGVTKLQRFVPVSDAPPPVSRLMSIEPPLLSLAPGQTPPAVKLSWDMKPYPECSLEIVSTDGSIVPTSTNGQWNWSGTYAVLPTPTRTTTYILTVKKKSGDPVDRQVVTLFVNGAQAKIAAFDVKLTGFAKDANGQVIPNSLGISFRYVVQDLLPGAVAQIVRLSGAESGGGRLEETWTLPESGKGAQKFDGSLQAAMSLHASEGLPREFVFELQVKDPEGKYNLRQPKSLRGPKPVILGFYVPLFKRGEKIRVIVVACWVTELTLTHKDLGSTVIKNDKGLVYWVHQFTLDTKGAAATTLFKFVPGESIAKLDLASAFTFTGKGPWGDAVKYEYKSMTDEQRLRAAVQLGDLGADYSEVKKSVAEWRDQAINMYPPLGGSGPDTFLAAGLQKGLVSWDDKFKQKQLVGGNYSSVSDMLEAHGVNGPDAIRSWCRDSGYPWLTDFGMRTEMTIAGGLSVLESTVGRLPFDLALLEVINEGLKTCPAPHPAWAFVSDKKFNIEPQWPVQTNLAQYAPKTLALAGGGSPFQLAMREDPATDPGDFRAQWVHDNKFLMNVGTGVTMTMNLNVSRAGLYVNVHTGPLLMKNSCLGNAVTWSSNEGPDGELLIYIDSVGDIKASIKPIP